MKFSVLVKVSAFNPVAQQFLPITRFAGNRFPLLTELYTIEKLRPMV